MLKPESGLYWSISCLQTKPQQSLNVVNVPHLIWITALSWAQHIIDKVRFTFTLTWIIRNNWLVSSSPPSPHSTLQSLGIINNPPCDRSGSDGWINLTQLNGLFKTNINHRGVITPHLQSCMYYGHVRHIWEAHWFLPSGAVCVVLLVSVL